MSYGAQIKFAIGRQTQANSWVTAAGSFHHIPLVSEDVGLTKEEVQSENLTGRFELGAVYDGVSRIDGTIEFEPEPWSLGAILMASVKNSAVSYVGSALLHTFVPRTADYSSLLCNEPITIYKQFADSTSAELYYDCQFGEVELTFRQGALMRARTTVVGGKRLANGIAQLSPTLHTADAQRNWLWDVVSVSYNGVALGQSTEVTVRLNEAIEPLFALNGTLEPYKYGRSGFREVNVSGTMYFTDREVYNDFIAGTQRRLVITARNTRAGLVYSGSYPTIMVDVPQLKVTQFKPGASGPGEVVVSFTGRGVTDSTSNYAAQFLLTNSHLAY